jgi:prolyl-tRNA synthetase
MRFSKIFLPTVKEEPADADIISHRLMVRAGLMRRLSSGTYSYLPIGLRCLQKVTNIVREEMNRTGAQEIVVPIIQPIELWQKSGRDVDYGENLFRLKDRHGREMVLAPTAEEVFTDLAANEIKSYKQMPINLYQIQFKFRDEFRPRFGALRSREFIMKDAYSFDVDADGLHKTYMKMHDAYCRIFKRCGLDFVIVEAESGEIGGSGSHQFTVPCESGEDVIVYFEDNSRAWNLEKVPVDPLPKQKAPANIPAIELVHTPNVGSIESVCNFLKCQPKDLIKTLIFSTGGKTIAALVRGDHELNQEKLTQALDGKHAELADAPTIEKVTGAKVGFAGPVGIADNVDYVFIDFAVAAMAVGVTGANKTDYHIKNVVPGRDFPLEGGNIKVADLRFAQEGDTYEGKKLLFKRGIEVGQIFKLWTKYSEKLGAKFIDESGEEKSCLMGCYGIGINRIIAAAIEISHDDDGIIFPASIAPFEVIITCINQDDKKVVDVAEKIYQQLLDEGIEVLLDDRDERAGVKFKDADLIGIPVRVTVGKKSVQIGNVEIKLRTEKKNEIIDIEKGVEKVIAIVNALKDKLKP